MNTTTSEQDYYEKQQEEKRARYKAQVAALTQDVATGLLSAGAVWIKPGEYSGRIKLAAPEAQVRTFRWEVRPVSKFSSNPTSVGAVSVRVEGGRARSFPVKDGKVNLTKIIPFVMEQLRDADVRDVNEAKADVAREKRRKLRESILDYAKKKGLSQGSLDADADDDGTITLDLRRPMTEASAKRVIDLVAEIAAGDGESDDDA
jgi:hypothetical protein